MQDWLPLYNSLAPLFDLEDKKWIRKNDIWLSQTQSSNDFNLGAVQDVESLFDQINTSPGIQYAVIDLANVFFSVPVHKDRQYTRGQKYTITAYLKGLLTLKPHDTTYFKRTLVISYLESCQTHKESSICIYSRGE